MSLSDPGRPVIQPFRVAKSDLPVKIDVEDNQEGSERAYPGREVRPLELQISGSPNMLDRFAGSAVRSMTWAFDRAS